MKDNDSVASKNRKTEYVQLEPFRTPRLHLPSFRRNVAKSAPYVLPVPSGTNISADTATQSGDALSVSYFYEGSDLYRADQELLPLDAGYLKRILLEVFASEEYEDAEQHHASLERWEWEPKSENNRVRLTDFRLVRDPNATAQVRLSDLRLAIAIDTSSGEKEKTFKGRLLDILGGLELPLTTENVLTWKWETLKEHSPSLKGPRQHLSDWTDENWNEERERLILVSFAAAVLCLFLDLGMRDLQKANSEQLRDSVLALYHVMKKFAKSLDARTTELKRLMASRQFEEGRPPEAIKSYTALHLYRMGYSPTSVAQRIGITPFDKKTRTGSFNWLKWLKEYVVEGIDIEEQKLPHAAEVSARRDDPKVHQKALEAYRTQSERESWHGGLPYWDMLEAGDDLPVGIPANREDEIYRAYVQLGSCLERGLDPVPSAEH